MEGVTRRTWITMGAVPVAAGLAAYATHESGLWPAASAPRFEEPGSPREVLQRKHLPNLPLITHDGRQVRFYDDLVKDKKVLLSFVSSRAPAESRTVMHNLGQVQKFFGARMGRDVFLYSIARDPARDTQAVLDRWARRSGAGPGWKFLSGSTRDVDTLRHSLGFGSDNPAEDSDPRFAVGLLRQGVEPEMRWAHCQSQAKARVIAHSMLLDFGPAPFDANAPITWNVTGNGGAGSAPIWDCQLVLRGID
jgi:protein SCO1/2